MDDGIHDVLDDNVEDDDDNDNDDDDNYEDDNNDDDNDDDGAINVDETMIMMMIHFISTRLKNQN